MTDSDTTCTLISLILPPNCQVERVLGNTYRITCPDPGTGRGVWEKRHVESSGARSRPAALARGGKATGAALAA